MRLLYGMIGWFLITTSCFASSTCNDKELQLRMFHCVDPAAGHYPTYIITDPAQSGTLTVLDQDSNLITNLAIAFDGINTEVNYLNIPHPLSGQKLTLYYTSMDGCVIERSELFTVAPSFSIIKQDPTSYGSTDGAIQIDVITSNTEVLWPDGSKGYNRSGLAAGNYSITITSASKCNEEVTVTLTHPTVLNAVHKPTIVECNGESDRLYKAYTSGGVPPYEYIWTVDGIVQPLNDPTIHFVNSNDVSLVVRDSNGNVAHSTLVDTDITINSVLLNAVAIPALRVTGSGEDIYDLSMALDVDYGDADNDKGDGSIYDITYHETIQAAMSNTSAMNTSVVSSTATTYYLRAQSKNDCFDVAPLSLLSTSYCLAVSEACDTDSPVELRPRDCTRDANPLPSGGTFRIFRRLQPANELGPEVPEALVFINGAAHFDPDNREGNFFVQYTYNDGAQDITSMAFFDVQSVNPSLFIDRDTVCGNDLEVLMLANPVGGTLVGTGIIDSYTSGTNQAYLIDPQMLEVNQNHDFTYRYSNTNQSGLVCFQNATEVLHVEDYPRIDALADADAQCEGTAVTQEISVINPGIISSYTWTLNGDTISTSRNLNVPSITVSSVFSFSATSFNGCISQDQVEVMVNPTPRLACDLAAAVTCPGGDDAFATVEIIGVSDYSTYNFLWSNGATEETATGLSAGRYTVTVTDPNGCIDSCSVDVTEPPAFDIICDFNIQPPACAGGSNGSTEVNVLNGGTPPYSYSRDNITFTLSNTISGYASGPQIVYVRDALGCVDSCSFNIPETILVTCNIDNNSVQGVSCMGGADGQATVGASGGTGTYTYLWDNGEVDATAIGLDAGNHSVVVTDSNGCSTVCNVTITEPPLLSCILQVQSPISCNAGDDGAASVEVSGGTMPYNYLWSNGSSSATAGDLSRGTYSVTITDTNACTTTCTIDLQDPLPLTASIEPAGVCQGDMVELTVNVDSRVVTHSWSITSINTLGAVLQQTNQVTVKVDAMQAQSGVITLTYVGLDPNACLVETTVDLEIQAAPTAGVDEQTTICNTDITEYVVDLPSLLSPGAAANGTWTYIGPLTGPDLSNPQAVSFECLAAGAYPFTYTVAPVDLCPGQEATITVNVEDCFDLAIRKTIDTRVLTSLEEPVIFDIEIFNQGRVTAHEVSITDYIEEEFYFDPAKNTSTGTGNSHDWEPSGENAELRIGTIPPFSSILVQIRLDVNPTFQEEVLYNSAEITNYGIASVSGGIKLLPPDEDDFPTPPPTRDDEIDDEIDDDSTGGEDDDDDDDQFDFATVTLCGGSATQLNCNDLVNVSLDAQCEALITPNMLLEGQHPSRYRVELRDSDGNLLPNPLTAEHLDMSIEAKVLDDCTPNSCWSILIVEDKLAPTITCIEDVTISCLEAYYNHPIPDAVDACQGLIPVTVSSDEVLETCEGIYRARRDVSYYAIDDFGNVSDTCTFSIYYDSISHDQITIEAIVELECDDQDQWDTNGNYYPDVYEVGVPTAGDIDLVQYPNQDLSEPLYENYCAVNVTFSDSRRPVCKNSYTVVRDWTVLDWCNGKTIKLNQTIRVVDTQGPEVDLPTYVAVLHTDEDQCTSDYIVPPPSILSECSDSTSYIVRYRITDPLVPVQAGLFIDDQVLALPNGQYIVRDLPIGSAEIQYVVTDACGNNSTATSEVFITDNQVPTPVCDQSTVVTLTSNGVATINAHTFDDGSHDNCSTVTVDARRLDAGCSASQGYGAAIPFCCEDVGQEIMVELRVWDDANGNGVFGDVITKTFDTNGSGTLGDIVGGIEDQTVELSDLSNTCMVSVLVQDKNNPTIVCPSDTTLECGAAYTDLSITGAPNASDNCSILNITHSDLVQLDQCGVGRIIRTFTVTDLQGLQSSCQQTISIVNSAFFDFDDLSQLEYPADVHLQGCEGQSTDISDTGEPKINQGSCSLVAYTYTDRVFALADSACYKIHRNFSVVDWCQFDAAVPGQGIDQYVQTIYVYNEIAPTIGNCRDTTICIFDEDCEGAITIAADAYDDCTASELLQYNFSLDVGNDGNMDYTGFAATSTFQLEPGIHRVSWTVSDRCGNSSQCAYLLTVEDCKKPTPYCLSEITTVLMPSTGQVSVSAKDFDLGSTDNCEGPLHFSFDEDGVDTTIAYRCDQLGINEVTIWVTDQNGNRDFCTTWVDIQSNSNCDASGNGRIAGLVINQDAEPLNQVTMQLESVDSGELGITEASGGLYAFEDLDPGFYRLSSNRNTDHSQGVSTLDLVMIQRHILGIASLDSPYKVIAADVNKSESISGADIVELRRLILGITDVFEFSDSWVFVEKEREITEATQWLIPDALSINLAPDSTYTQDFIGIKMGDVNESATNGLTMGSLDPRSTDPVVLIQRPARHLPNGNLSIAIANGEPSSTLLGYQMTLQYDSQIMKFLGIEEAGHPIQSQHYREVEPGHIVIALDMPNGNITQQGATLFDIVFVPREQGVNPHLYITDEIVRAEAYDELMTTRSVELIKEGEKPNITLLQNSPNPFNEKTQITFEVEQSAHISLKIYDVTGRVLKTNNGEYQAGIHTVEVLADDLGNPSGVLYYQITSGKQVLTKKMMVLR